MSKKIGIKRFENNPLIKPDPGRAWMSTNVFNCGVVKDDDGLYKMLFRAAYTKNQAYSSLGFAQSKDGLNWDVFDKPVLKSGFNAYCEKGIEDPRIVKWIDGWYYVFATAYSSIGFRIGIWKTKDFFKYQWIGLPFNYRSKNAAIVSEPIDGWVYLIHRRLPNIWVVRTDDLTLKDNWRSHRFLIKTEEIYANPITGEPPLKIGIAGPPIKTEKGWLTLIHVVHKYRKDLPCEKNLVYSLGFMVLNSKDPTLIDYLHPEPILWPEKPYEIQGSMPRTCFSCATVDTGGDEFYVYWGGADTVICGGRLMKKDLMGICY